MFRFFIFSYLLCFLLQVSLKAEVSVYGVVLAGGSGKRLWPLSRKQNPKQFIPFINGKTLLGQTLSRNKNLTSNKNLWVVTTEVYSSKIISKHSKLVDNIIAEPLPKNTAPAILLSVMQVHDKDPNAIVFFVPADHYIPNKELYCHYLTKAIDYASKNDDIVLLGIQPRNPSSDYGYIEYGDIKEGSDLHAVIRFHEKPIQKTAELYLKAGNFLWNAGIFCAKAKVFMQHFDTYNPKLLNGMRQYLKTKDINQYAALEDIPFDRAILEKTDKCVVIPSHFFWSDVGSLEQFLLISNKEKSIKNPLELHVHAKNNLVMGPEKMVVVLGLDDLCIVETSDVLFVTSRNETERVREVIKKLDANGYSDYT